MPSEYGRQLIQGITGLLTSDKYSDATIQCGERRWRVHRSIVCTRCEFFERAFDECSKEGKVMLNTLEDDHPNAVAAMVRYLYSADYDDAANEGDGDQWDALVMNIRVNAIGNKYGLAELSLSALKKFRGRILAEGSNALGFLEALSAAYADDEHIEEPVRQLLMQCIMKSGKALLAREDFKQLAKSLPTLATALASEVFELWENEKLQRSRPYSFYRCSACNIAFGVEHTVPKEQYTAHTICCPGHGGPFHIISAWESNYSLDRGNDSIGTE
ncbi:hypothetical protein BST61_g8244 [Cercospora zeina]